MRERAVCIRNGCVWLSGGVCSRRCVYARTGTGNGEGPGVPPPPKGKEEWTAWFRRYWNRLRRFYGRAR